MKKLISIVILGIFILSGLGAVAENNTNMEKNTITFSGGDETHTVFAELGTSTMCGFCKYAHGALKNIYEQGNYDFYYISLVDDKNTVAEARIDEYNFYGFPTVWFDGGYIVEVGAGSIPSAQINYQNAITQAENRNVPDIDVTLYVEWLGDAAMDINVIVDNNEEYPYDGHICVYVNEIESSMGWYDTAGNPYTFPFLHYAFNEEINIIPGGEWIDSTIWDGNYYGYGDITYGNLMVIAVVYNSDWHQGYSYPPSQNPFDAYYVDDVAAYPLADNVPPEEPSNSDPSNGEIDVDLNANLYWTCGDPNPGDQVTYDVYFGTTNPPSLVNAGQTSTTYDLGTMEFGTIYYWQIVATDSEGESTQGPIWSFTTVLDPNPTPEPPEILGPTSGKPGSVYLYRFSSIDPDQDDVFFYIEWGDGTVEEWIGPYESGEQGSVQHCWGEEGTYEIRIKAKDVQGAESDWTTLEVSMPVNKHNLHSPLFTLFQKIIQQFPILEQLLSAFLFH